MGAAAVACLLLSSCARTPDASPAVARPARAAPDASTARAGAVDACLVVSTVLTEPDLAHGGLSALERPEAARAQTVDGKWVVALTSLDEAGRERSFHPQPVDCGERLMLVGEKGPWPAGVEPFAVRLTSEGPGVLRFALAFAPPARQASEGRLARDETGEWRVLGPSKKVPRPLDAAPVERALLQAMPAGQASAWLELDTGGDTSGSRALETGLVLVVHLGTRELRQVFASCPQGAKGSALGALERDVLDTAACGDVYRLMRKQTGAGPSVQTLVVDEQLPNGDWQPTVTLELPPDIRAVSSPSIEGGGTHGR